MKNLRRSSNNRLSDTSGFSLIELVTVLSVLGSLTVISLVGFTGTGGILGAIKSSEIDEAKALLNKAAADCLQKGRIGGENQDIIDEEIISDIRINSIGFKINKADKADKCSYLQLIPSKEDDDVRYPIGFSVIDGTLTKLATPTSSNEDSIKSCERWAGVNCKQDESLKRLIAWKKDIAANKAVCEDNYTKWLTVDNTTPNKFQRWNPSAETGCPKRPPQKGSESYRTDPYCTPKGCNRDVYGIDGELCGYTPEDYEECLNRKYGKVCVEWVAEKKQQEYTNNTTTLLPIRKTPECGSQEFWFFKGEDQGTKTEFMETACNAWVDEKKSENYTNNPKIKAATTPICGDKQFWFFNGEDQGSYVNLQSAQCAYERERARESGFTGKWGPKEGPGICSEESYICERKIVNETEYYKTCGAAPAKCKTSLTRFDQDCANLELSDYWFRKCDRRPVLSQNDPEYGAKTCREVGWGKPTKGGWDKTPACRQWAECMNLYE